MNKKASAMMLYLLVLLVLGMIIPPVSAWSELWTETYTGSGGTANGGSIWFKNGTAWKNANPTRLTFVGDANCGNTGYSDNFKMRASSSGTYYADVTVTYSTSSTGNYSAYHTEEYLFSNIQTGNLSNSAFTGNFFGASNGVSMLTTYGQCYDKGDLNTATNALSSRAGETRPQSGVWTLYGGSAVVEPVAAFSNGGVTCLYSNEYISYVDESTNTPTSWEWVITNNDDYFWDDTTQDIVLHQMTSAPPGEYDVQLCATNAAGTDCEFKEAYLTVGAPGECTYNSTLNVTPQPTLGPVPTGIGNFINMSQWRAGCKGSALGNATDRYCDGVDDFSNVTNATFSSVITIFTLPLDWITDALESTHSNIDDLVAPLIQQSSVFLGVMTRALAALPAVFINLVTLGLLIDVVRIVLRGKGGE